MLRLLLCQLTLLGKLLKIKETFPNLQNKQIENIQKIIRSEDKPKPKINMTMKGLSRKQVIVPMDSNNKMSFMKESSAHTANINKALKNIKSKVTADFVRIKSSDIIITTNKVAVSLDLQTIECYVKNINNIEANKVEAPRLPQLKSYLKILGISYLLENSNTPISANVVERIIKENYIFNNIIITSRPRVIKVSPKSDMTIIWLNIWDVQSGSKAKGLINQCFNVRSHITTICGANMNLGISQCKNCWK